MTVPVEPPEPSAVEAPRCGHGLAFSPKIGSFHRLREEPDPDGSYRWMPCDRPPEPSAVEEDWRAAMPGRREDPTFVMPDITAPEPSAVEEALIARLRSLTFSDYQLEGLLTEAADALAAARAELARLRQQVQAVRRQIGYYRKPPPEGHRPNCDTCMVQQIAADAFEEAIGAPE